MNHRLMSKLNTSWTRLALAAAVGLVVSASSAQAQRPVPAKPKSQQQSQPRRDQIVPPGFFPPAGMCRIWLNDVPPGQQPAPTDCASAVRNRPANGKVLFGDEPKSKKGKSDKKGQSSSAGEIIDLITRRIPR
jgi:hypothetical protein